MQKECIFMPFHVNLKTKKTLKNNFPPCFKLSLLRKLTKCSFLKMCYVLRQHFPLYQCQLHLEKKNNNCSMAINYWFYIENNVWVTSIFTTVSADTYCISRLFCFSSSHRFKAMINSYFFPLVFHSVVGRQSRRQWPGVCKFFYRLLFPFC